MFVTIFFLIVLVGGAYLVWRKHFRDEDQRTRKAQEEILNRARTAVSPNAKDTFKVVDDD